MWILLNKSQRLLQVEAAMLVRTCKFRKHVFFIACWWRMHTSTHLFTRIIWCFQRPKFSPSNITELTVALLSIPPSSRSQMMLWIVNFRYPDTKRSRIWFEHRNKQSFTASRNQLQLVSVRSANCELDYFEKVHNEKCMMNCCDLILSKRWNPALYSRLNLRRLLCRNFIQISIWLPRI